LRSILTITASRRVAGLLFFRGRRFMRVMNRSVCMVLGLMLAAMVSCDSEPPPPPATAVTEVARIALAGAAPQVLAISPTGSRVTVRLRGSGGGGGSGSGGDAKESVQVLDLETQQWVESANPATVDERLDAVTYSPDGRYEARLFLLPRLHRAMRVHRLPDAHECFALETNGHALTPVAFAADSKSFLRPDPPARGKPFAFVIVDPDTGSIRATLQLNPQLLAQGVFHRIAFTPDGKWVFAHQDAQVVIWNVATGQVAGEWRWPGTGAVAAIGCTPDSRIVRALMQEGTVADMQLLSTPLKASVNRLSVPKLDPKEPRRIPFDKPWSFIRATFSPDAARVLRDAGDRIDVYDVQSGALTQVFTLPAGATQVNFEARQRDLVPVSVQQEGGHAVAIVRLPP
jgi:hypothetical protein